MLERVLSYRYEITAFVAGMSVMMLEIVGARRIAPYFGTSVYVWTAMIGVILGALAIGFWYGGRLADRREHTGSIVLVFVIAAALILLSVFLEAPVLDTLARADLDLRLSSFLAALLLFAPPSLFIGMISPHLAKVRLLSLETTGRTIGRLEAAGTLGSITGTFLCGYVLLSLVGSRSITLVLVIILIACSYLINAKLFRISRLILALAVLIFLCIPVPTLNAVLVADVDTAHARYRILRSQSEQGPIHYMTTSGDGIQSAIYVNDPSIPALGYVERMVTVALASRTNEPLLMIGGGAHTLPTVLHETNPGMPITIAEIDEGLDEIARSYFAFDPPATTKVVYKDGRDFLRTNTDHFGKLFVDAYSSLTPPFHLTTTEAVAAMKDRLVDDGVLVANIIGSEQGKNREFLERITSTYASQFAHVAVIPVTPELPRDIKQNYLLIASDREAEVSTALTVLDTREANIASGSKVFTDDFAPVERLSF